MRVYVFNPRVRNEIVRKMRRGLSVAAAERTYGVPRTVLKAWLAEPEAAEKRHATVVRRRDRKVGK